MPTTTQQDIKFDSQYKSAQHPIIKQAMICAECDSIINWNETKYEKKAGGAICNPCFQSLLPF